MTTTASERAEQLAKMPMDQAPYPAIALIKHLSAKYGACGELYYHAYTCYAKYVENLPGGSEDLEAKNFFLSREAAAEAIRKQVPPAWHNIFRSDNMIP